MIRMTSRPAVSETQPTGSSAGKSPGESVLRDSETLDTIVARSPEEPSVYGTGVLYWPRGRQVLAGPSRARLPAPARPSVAGSQAGGSFAARGVAPPACEAAARAGSQRLRRCEGGAGYRSALAAAGLLAGSALIREAVAAGRLSIRSAYFEIGTGLVTLL